MASKAYRNRAAASGRRAPATPHLVSVPAAPASALDPPPPPPRDANGFDPTEFEWRPVARRPRADGWTPEVQIRFIQALADTGLVSAAARAVDMSVTSCYRLRSAAGSEGFARAWRSALAAAADRIVDIAFERAIEGEEVPVFHDGVRVGSRRRYDHRTAMFIMRAYLPDRFRHAHQSIRQPHEAPSTPELPLADALAALQPVAPADPHLTADPEALARSVSNARANAALPQQPDANRERYVHPREEDPLWAAAEAPPPPPPGPSPLSDFTYWQEAERAAEAAAQAEQDEEDLDEDETDEDEVVYEFVDYGPDGEEIVIEARDSSTPAADDAATDATHAIEPRMP